MQIDKLCTSGECAGRKFVDYDQFFDEYQVYIVIFFKFLMDLLSAGRRQTSHILQVPHRWLARSLTLDHAQWFNQLWYTAWGLR